MRVIDWMECGYTLEEARACVIKYANEIDYETEAHRNYYNSTN